MAIVWFLASLFCIAFGGFALFRPDIYWHWYRYSQGLKPEAFEQNELLECHRVFLGSLSLLLGIFGFFNALSMI